MRVEDIQAIVGGVFSVGEIDDQIAQKAFGLISWTYGLHSTSAYKDLNSNEEFTLIFGMASLLAELLTQDEAACHYAISALDKWHKWAMKQVAQGGIQ